MIPLKSSETIDDWGLTQQNSKIQSEAASPLWPEDKSVIFRKKNNSKTCYKGNLAAEYKGVNFTAWWDERIKSLFLQVFYSKFAAIEGMGIAIWGVAEDRK